MEKKFSEKERKKFNKLIIGFFITLITLIVLSISLFIASLLMVNNVDKPIFAQNSNIPSGYRLLTASDVGKTFGTDLENLVYFDTSITPIFGGPIEYVLFSDASHISISSNRNEFLEYDENPYTQYKFYEYEWLLSNYSFNNLTINSIQSYNNDWLYVKDIVTPTIDVTYDLTNCTANNTNPTDVTPGDTNKLFIFNHSNTYEILNSNINITGGTLVSLNRASDDSGTSLIINIDSNATELNISINATLVPTFTFITITIENISSSNLPKIYTRSSYNEPIEIIPTWTRTGLTLNSISTTLTFPNISTDFDYLIISLTDITQFSYVFDNEYYINEECFYFDTEILLSTADNGKSVLIPYDSTTSTDLNIDYDFSVLLSQDYEMGLNRGTSFSSMFASLVNAPFTMLKQYFDFELFGVNFGTLAIGLLTLSLLATFTFLFIKLLKKF